MFVIGVFFLLEANTPCSPRLLLPGAERWRHKQYKADPSYNHDELSRSEKVLDVGTPTSKVCSAYKSCGTQGSAAVCAVCGFLK